LTYVEIPLRYALVNDQRHDARASLSGICPGCGQAMTPKCGGLRIHHWAHKGIRSCDPWWEPETPWHRAWKAQFSTAWQEVILRGKNGEKHIADVRTEHGLVLEFQHSAIAPLERQSREAFYRNMVWIVDGTRRKREMPRFEQGRRSLQVSAWRGVYTTRFPDECFPRDWLDSTVPAFFDFATMESDPPDTAAERRLLWGVLPGRADGQAVIVALDRQRFVLAARTRPQILAARSIVGTLDARFRAARAQATIAARRYSSRSAWRRWRPRRRTPRF
jgi:hypothetical protein